MEYAIVVVVVDLNKTRQLCKDEFVDGAGVEVSLDELPEFALSIKRSNSALRQGNGFFCLRQPYFSTPDAGDCKRAS